MQSQSTKRYGLADPRFCSKERRGALCVVVFEVSLAGSTQSRLTQTGRRLARDYQASTPKPNIQRQQLAGYQAPTGLVLPTGERHEVEVEVACDELSSKWSDCTLSRCSRVTARPGAPHLGLDLQEGQRSAFVSCRRAAFLFVTITHRLSTVYLLAVETLPSWAAASVTKTTSELGDADGQPPKSVTLHITQLGMYFARALPNRPSSETMAHHSC